MSERTRAKERSEWGGWRMVEGEDGGGSPETSRWLVEARG
jgi:hypothetical protein